MKKNALVILLVLAVYGRLYAQVPKGVPTNPVTQNQPVPLRQSPRVTVTGTLRIPVADSTYTYAISLVAEHVELSGYDGKDLIIEPLEPQESPKPTKFDGLTRISKTTRQPEDPSITYNFSGDSPGKTRLRLETRGWGLRVKVPNKIKDLQLSALTDARQPFIKLSDLRSSFRLEVPGGDVDVRRVTGPFTLSTYSAKVTVADLLWNEGASNRRMAVNTTDGLIDFAIPDTVKASLWFSVRYGKVFSELALDEQRRLNGGGFPIELDVQNGKAYLRKQN